MNSTLHDEHRNDMLTEGSRSNGTNGIYRPAMRTHHVAQTQEHHVHQRARTRSVILWEAVVSAKAISEKQQDRTGQERERTGQGLLGRMGKGLLWRVVPSTSSRLLWINRLGEIESRVSGKRGGGWMDD